MTFTTLNGINNTLLLEDNFMTNWYDREINELEASLESGEISSSQYREFVKDLNFEYMEIHQEVREKFSSFAEANEY